MLILKERNCQQIKLNVETEKNINLVRKKYY